MVSLQSKISLSDKNRATFENINDDSLVISSIYSPKELTPNVSDDRFDIDKLVLSIKKSTIEFDRENCNTIGYESTGLFSIDIESPKLRDDSGNVIESEIIEDALRFTSNQAILTKRGWCAVLPQSNTQPFISFDEKKLEEGDEVFMSTDWAKIVKINFIYLEPTTEVYSLSIEDTGTYYANGILIHE